MKSEYLKRAHKSDRRSLWGAVARDRFGSRLRILRTSGRKDASGLPFHHCQSSKWTTKAFPSDTAGKLGISH